MGYPYTLWVQLPRPLELLDRHPIPHSGDVAQLAEQFCHYRPLPDPGRWLMVTDLNGQVGGSSPPVSTLAAVAP